MSTIAETLRQIAERIATLEAERDRLLRELVAMSSRREDNIVKALNDGSVVTVWTGR